MDVVKGDRFLASFATWTNNGTSYGLIFTFVFSLAYFSYTKLTRRKGYPDGPWGLPFIGHIPLIGSNPIETFAKWRKKHGDVYRIRFGCWNTIVVNGYEGIKEAVDKPDDDFSSKPAFVMQNIMTKINGKTFNFAAFDPSYRRQRKYTVAAFRTFTHRFLKHTEDIINVSATDFVNCLLSKDRKKPIDITPDIMVTVVRLVFNLLYGSTKQNEIKERIPLIVEESEEFGKLNKIGNLINVMPWLRFVMPWKLSKLINILWLGKKARILKVEEHMETFSHDVVRDITDIFLKENIEDEEELNKPKSERLTKTDLLSTLTDLEGAGHGTTVKVLQWLMLYMAAYPDIQKQVQSEIDHIIGAGRCVQLADRPNLVYTEATILEVLRITILVPFGVPKYTVKDTTLNGYDIDKDTVVFFNLHSVSFDEEFWGDPEVFRPSRLITADGKLDRSKCARILAFGIGRRKCVAEQFAKMALVLTFATILQRCSILKPEGEELDLTPIRHLVYYPKGFKIMVKQR